MECRDLAYKSLSIPAWTLAADECWCLLGGNGSGKSLLASLITGQEVPDGGALIDRPEPSLWVSFESQQERYEEELRNDDSDFLDRIDTGSTGLELLLEAGDETRALALAASFGITDLLDRGLRLFSSGELRKMLILKEVLKQPALLILDEPYEGLDAASRTALSDFCQELLGQGQALLLLVNRLADVAPWCTHLALLQKGRLLTAGARESVLAEPEVEQLMHFDRDEPPVLPAPPSGGDIPLAPATKQASGREDARDHLVRMRNCTVRYGEICQFEGFDWTLRPGEHTLITGANGAGKSTLLQLIVGDHPQCYTNELDIFGYRRGSGESIWDIKRHIGLVSASLHRDYRASGNVLSVVVSGLFDSIGLYQRPERAELLLAQAWLDVVGLGDAAGRMFRQLSYGQQRLVLIARGLIKQPPLLILDEPTQGLDDMNRHLVLAFIETLAALERTTMLFVSHREDEHLPLFRHQVHFQPSAKEGVRFEAVVGETDS